MRTAMKPHMGKRCICVFSYGFFSTFMYSSSKWNDRLWHKQLYQRLEQKQVGKRILPHPHYRRSTHPFLCQRAKGSGAGCVAKNLGGMPWTVKAHLPVQLRPPLQTGW